MLDVVGRQHDGTGRLGVLGHHPLQHDQRLLVEPALRLVHQENVGVAGERAGQSDPLAHSPRELIGEALAPALELHRVELLFRHGSPLLLADAAKLEAEGNVVDHGAMRQ